MENKNAVIGYFTEYRGYKGTIEYDYEDHIYHGKIINTDDFVNYHAKNMCHHHLMHTCLANQQMIPIY